MSVRIRALLLLLTTLGSGRSSLAQQMIELPAAAKDVREVKFRVTFDRGADEPRGYIGQGRPGDVPRCPLRMAPGAISASRGAIACSARSIQAPW